MKITIVTIVMAASRERRGSDDDDCCKDILGPKFYHQNRLKSLLEGDRYVAYVLNAPSFSLARLHVVC